MPNIFIWKLIGGIAIVAMVLFMADRYFIEPYREELRSKDRELEAVGATMNLYLKEVHEGLKDYVKVVHETNTTVPSNRYNLTRG